jgi:hypothetical protein
MELDVLYFRNCKVETVTGCGLLKHIYIPVLLSYFDY